MMRDRTEHVTTFVDDDFPDVMIKWHQGNGFNIYFTEDGFGEETEIGYFTSYPSTGEALTFPEAFKIADQWFSDLTLARNLDTEEDFLLSYS